MADTTPRIQERQSPGSGNQPRPLEVTLVCWLFIVGSAGGLIALIGIQVGNEGLSILHNLGAAAGIGVHLSSGVLMLRGTQWGRVVFWLGVPVLLPILAALRSFDWLILAGIAATWFVLGLLDTEAADRYFLGAHAEVGSHPPGGKDRPTR